MHYTDRHPSFTNANMDPCFRTSSSTALIQRFCVVCEPYTPRLLNFNGTASFQQIRIDEAPRSYKKIFAIGFLCCLELYLRSNSVSTLDILASRLLTVHELSKTYLGNPQA